MSLNPRLTLYGMYEYSNDLFSLLNLPDTISKETFIDVLMLNYGENPLCYPNLNFMIRAIGAWSNKWYDAFVRIATAINAEYNPIHNFDRHEEYTDEEGKTTSGNATDCITGSTTETDGTTVTRDVDTTEDSTVDRDSTIEEKISAFNESTYQPNRQQITDETTETDASGSIDETVISQRTGNTSTTQSKTAVTSGSEDRELTHTGHLYGNIGITTSQSMILDELDLRTNNNIYDIATKIFYREFCLYVY